SRGPDLVAPRSRHAGGVGRDVRAGLDGRAARAPGGEREDPGVPQRGGQVWTACPYLPWLRGRKGLRTPGCRLRNRLFNLPRFRLPVSTCWWPASGTPLPSITPTMFVPGGLPTPD